MGGTGVWAADAPSNVIFVGWLSDPAPLYARSSCVIRLVEHDSIGATAVEGLLFGRPVIYSQDLAYTEKVDISVEIVVSAIERLYDRHQQGSLEPDNAAAAWACGEFDHVRRFVDLADYLRSLVAGTSSSGQCSP